MTSREQARRGLAVYFGVVLVISAALEGWIIAHGGLGGPTGWPVLPLMYTPALGSIVARLAGREGFADGSFRWGGSIGTRASLTAWLPPVGHRLRRLWDCLDRRPGRFHAARRRGSANLGW